MSSNSIYFTEWNTGVGHKIRAEIYPLSTKTGTNTTLPAFESRYVQLPDDILLSVGSISSQFEMLPMGVPETGTLQVSVNLSHCPDHLRERFLGNKANHHPAVWAIFIAPDGETWEQRALFVGVQKRIPSMSIKLNHNGDEIIDFDIIDIFRFCFETVQLNDEGILAYINTHENNRVERLYDYAIIEDGNKLHADYAMGSPPDPGGWLGIRIDPIDYRHSAHMTGLSVLITQIRVAVNLLYCRLFCQEAEEPCITIDYDGVQLAYAHRRIVNYFDAATNFANTISETQSDSDLYIVFKITERQNVNNIVGGELYDPKAGLLKLKNCFDFFKSYCENFVCKLSFAIEGFPHTDDIPMLHIKTIGAFEGVAHYNYGGVESSKMLRPLHSGIDIEVGNASIRGCRAIIQNPADLDATTYEDILTGAESERDYDVLLYFHNLPTIAASDNVWQPNRITNPDVKNGWIEFFEGPMDRHADTMSSSFDFFPYSKVYLRYSQEHVTDPGGRRPLPWTNVHNIFIKPAENITINDGMATYSQTATTHPTITKFKGDKWTRHKTAVQAGKDSRVGIAFAVADYMTKVFGSPNNMELTCSTTNVFLFDLGSKIFNTDALTLDLRELGFTPQTTAIAKDGHSNIINAITSVDFNLMSGISKITIFIKGE